jgi:hypothetical protein
MIVSCSISNNDDKNHNNGEEDKVGFDDEVIAPERPLLARCICCGNCGNLGVVCASIAPVTSSRRQPGVC